MKSTTRAKRHHAVPQFHLKKFTSGGGMLWLHDLSDRTARRVHPRDAMVEKHLYAPEVGEDPYDDAFERFLSVSVEAPSAEPLKLLGEGERISDEQRTRVATFLAYQEWRVPRMQRLVKQVVAD